MITILDTTTSDVFATIRQRSVHRSAETETVVSEMIEDVRQRGDEALLDSARRFDAPGLTKLVSEPADWAQAQVSAGTLQALERALYQVQAFHSQQLIALTQGWSPFELQPATERHAEGQPLHVLPNFEYRWEKHPLQHQGWKRSESTGAVGQRLLPLRTVGAYVPGGNASYPSSVIMNVIPAQCAGVNAVFVTTPARRDGTLHPAVMAALAMCGVARAFCVGGAAAIAGLALGTESIPRVDKVVGPGNRFVNEAKRQLWGQVGLDGYAGPSEVAVLIDPTSRAKYAAADLLTQIEHAPDNAGFLVATNRAKLDETLAEVERQVAEAPREATFRQALAGASLAILARDEAEACAIINAIAPEHLSIATRDPEATMARIHNAGCVLLGEWSPESVGDFAAGPSHTLPTSGSARFGSPVNVLDFLKVQSVIRLSREDLTDLAPTVEAFGDMEGFPAHACGSRVRFED